MEHLPNTSQKCYGLRWPGLWDTGTVQGDKRGVLVCTLRVRKLQGKGENCVMAYLFVLVIKYYQGDQNKEGDMDWECSTHGRDE
jgi:hypothetical protein